MLFKRKLKRSEWMRGLVEAEKNYSKDTPEHFTCVSSISGMSFRDYYESFMYINESEDFIDGYNSYKKSQFAHMDYKHAL